MRNDILEMKRKLEEQLASSDLSEKERQRILKLLEMFQEAQTPEGLKDVMGRQTRSVVIAVVAGIVGLGLLIGGLMYGITWYTSNIVERTVAVPGDPARFDPVGSLAAVRAFAGEGSKLLSIDAQYVKSDGTMDLKASYRPTAEYEFFRSVPPPKDAPPVGAGSSPDGTWFEPVAIDVYEPGQWRHVKRMGGGVSTEYSYRNNGMERDASTPVSSPPGKEIPDPTCAFADLWKAAIGRGASPDAVASIEYDEDGYAFSINGTDVRLEFGTDCAPKE